MEKGFLDILTSLYGKRALKHGRKERPSSVEKTSDPRANAEILSKKEEENEPKKFSGFVHRIKKRASRGLVASERRSCQHQTERTDLSLDNGKEDGSSAAIGQKASNHKKDIHSFARRWNKKENGKAIADKLRHGQKKHAPLYGSGRVFSVRNDQDSEYAFPPRFSLGSNERSSTLIVNEDLHVDPHRRKSLDSYKTASREEVVEIYGKEISRRKSTDSNQSTDGNQSLNRNTSSSLTGSFEMPISDGDFESQMRIPENAVAEHHKSPAQKLVPQNRRRRSVMELVEDQFTRPGVRSIEEEYRELARTLANNEANQEECEQSTSSVGEQLVMDMQMRNIMEQRWKLMRIRIEDTEMPFVKQDRAITLARRLVDIQQDKVNAKSICKELKEDFDRQYGGDWHCLMGTNFHSSVSHSKQCFLYFAIDQYHILLYRTQPKRPQQQ